MNTLEKLRRQRPDVCSFCGWGLIVIERATAECVNPCCRALGLHGFRELGNGRDRT